DAGDVASRRLPLRRHVARRRRRPGPLLPVRPGLPDPLLRGRLLRERAGAGRGDRGDREESARARRAHAGPVPAGRHARRGRAGAAGRRRSARARPPGLPRGRGRVVAEEGGGRPMTEGGGGRRAAPTGAIPLLAAAILAIASLYFLVLSTRIVRARGPIEWV